MLPSQIRLFDFLTIHVQIQGCLFNSLSLRLLTHLRPDHHSHVIAQFPPLESRPSHLPVRALDQREIADVDLGSANVAVSSLDHRCSAALRRQGEAGVCSWLNLSISAQPMALPTWFRVTIPVSARLGAS